MNKMVRVRDVIYSEIPPFPKNMLIELTNACNQRCVFCPQKSQKRKIVHGDIDLIFNILEQAYDNGTREVGFYMNGEPLLCADLEKYIEKASTIGYDYIYLTSNGVLATVDRLVRLEKAGLSSIKFSINASTRESYKYIHGKDDFETVKANIEELYTAKLQGILHLPVFLSFVKNNDNKQDVDLLYEQFEMLVDDIYVHDADNRVGIMTDNVRNMEVKVEPCAMIFNRIHINSSGFLTACCSDYDGMLTIADLRKVSLKEAWESELFVGLRKQHLEKSIGDNQCFNCIYNIDRKDIEPLNMELYYREKTMLKNRTRKLYRNVIIFGATPSAKKICEEIEKEYNIVAFCDNDKSKSGGGFGVYRL